MDNLHIGKVTDNNHADQDGRVQIYIEHLHHDLTTDEYPWFKQDRGITSNIPEVNDYVWCWLLEPDTHRQGYYGNSVTLKEYHDHASTIGSMTTSYPDVKYWKLTNGVSIALSSNSNTPEISIYHPSAEIYVDSDGKLTMTTSSGDIVLNAGGNIEVNSSNGSSLEKTVLGEQLKTKLESLIDAITAITVTCAGPGNPSSVPINAATFTALKSQLTTILSEGVKNN